MHASSGMWAKKHAEDGFDMVTVTSDASFSSGAAHQEVTAARGEPTESHS